MEASRRFKAAILVAAVLIVGGLILGYNRLKTRPAAVTTKSPAATSFRQAAENDAPFRSVSADFEPSVRYWWEDVPADIREASLDTGELSNIRPRDYVGPQACKECHESNYRSWSEHRHRWMNAPANEATVKGDFSGAAKIDYFGGRATFFMDSDRYGMRLVRGDLRRTYEITQTLGSRFFQYYVGRQLDGPEPKPHRIYESEHVLPFGYWIDHGEWVPVVHVEETRDGEPSLADSRRRDPYANPLVKDYTQQCSPCHTTMPIGDWLLRRVPGFPYSPREFSFGMASYLSETHPDLLDARVDPASVPHDVIEQLLVPIANIKAPVWQVTSGISCEACHNGCDLHLDDEEEMPKFFPVSPHLFSKGKDESDPLGPTPRNQNWACARCHAGKRFEFAAGMATWNSVELADAYKGACYASTGGKRHLTCVHCHDPHKTLGPGWHATPDEDDAKCLECHEEYKAPAALAAHTHHAVGSSGSRCMECHMPRLNEGLQDMVRTHMIFSPTDARMIEADQPNACNMCHVDKFIDWTLGYLKEWYGATYSDENLAAVYNEKHREEPATVGWLRSWHPSTRMVAVDALIRAGATWALPELVRMLDSKYMLNRQFTLIGLQESLDIRLSDFGYRFYMFKNERREPLRKIRAALLKDFDIDPANFEETGDEPGDRVDESIIHYSQMLQAQPDNADAHFKLANALNLKGRGEEALRHFRRAVELRADFSEAHINLGVALAAQRKVDEAIGHYRTALQIDPDSTQAHHNLGVALAALGRLDEATDHFRRALQAQPDFARSHYALGKTLYTTGHVRDALRHYREALQTQPGWLTVLNGIAQILAANPDDSVRDPKEAIGFAERAAKLSDNNNSAILDTLAAAYASAGQFERAVSTAQRAIQLAEASDRAAEAADIRTRLELYRQGKPFREP